jgi:hypothetical protein
MWLQDEIYDNFVQNGRFTIGTKVEIPRRINDLVIWLLWTVVLCFPLFYYAVGFIWYGTWTLKLAVLLTIAIGKLCHYGCLKKLLSQYSSSLNDQSLQLKFMPSY